jgi:hypothetical protein
MMRILAPFTRASIALTVFAAGLVVAGLTGLIVLVYAAYGIVGTLLVIKRSGNVIGWILMAVAWEFAVGFLPLQGSVEDLQTLTAPPMVLTVAWLKSAWGLALVFTLLSSLAIVFPTGRLPVGPWRRPAMVLVLFAAGITLLAAVWPVLEVQPAGLDHQITMPNPVRLLPTGLTEAVPGAPGGAFMLLFAFLIASILSLLRRYARSTGVERLQLRWLVTGLASVAIAVPLGFILVMASDPAIEGLAWLPAMIAFTVPPIAIGIAVLRYRLYDIDRIISRTIGWAIVTGTLLVIFGGAVVGLQTLLSDVTQGQTLAVAASTLVAFALFQPLRRRVQAAVNHRFDRARVDADSTATAFADRLRDQIDLSGLEADIAATVEATLRPSSTGVWIRGGTR